MTALAAEIKTLNAGLGRMLYRDDYAAEVPLRVHSRGPDAGHGLGGPAFAPQFLAWLRDSGVCLCEPREIDGYMVMRHTCDRKRDRPVRGVRVDSRYQTRRIKRALRQLRNICEEEWAVVFPMLARGQSWEQMSRSVNERRLSHGQDALSTGDLLVLAISGFSKISASY